MVQTVPSDPVRSGRLRAFDSQGIPKSQSAVESSAVFCRVTMRLSEHEPTLETGQGGGGEPAGLAVESEFASGAWRRCRHESELPSDRTPNRAMPGGRYHVRRVARPGVDGEIPAPVALFSGLHRAGRQAVSLARSSPIPARPTGCPDRSGAGFAWASRRPGLPPGALLGADGRLR
jgi:hypothetical protein